MNKLRQMVQLYRTLRRSQKPSIFSQTLGWTALALVMVATLLFFAWPWLVTGETDSSTIFNILVPIVAIVGLPIALWRSWVAERQARTAQKILLDGRYQNGAKMLGSELVSTRLGGIYALQELAREHPRNYHIQVMQMFCAFFRDKAPRSKPLHHADTDRSDISVVLHDVYDLEEDCQAVIEAFGARTDEQYQLEGDRNYKLNLANIDLQRIRMRGANLTNADLTNSNFKGAELEGIVARNATLDNTNFAESLLPGAILDCLAPIPRGIFSGANLRGASLTFSNLSNTIFYRADLSGAWLYGARVSGVIFAEADISGTIFSVDGSDPVRGLTQVQLNLAHANVSNPPFLQGVMDAETGEPLVWK